MVLLISAIIINIVLMLMPGYRKRIMRSTTTMIRESNLSATSVLLFVSLHRFTPMELTVPSVNRHVFSLYSVYNTYGRIKMILYPNFYLRQYFYRKSIIDIILADILNLVLSICLLPSTVATMLLGVDEISFALRDRDRV